jgi:hypothetical protein
MFQLSKKEENSKLRTCQGIFAQRVPHSGNQSFFDNAGISNRFFNGFRKATQSILAPCYLARRKWPFWVFWGAFPVLWPLRKGAKYQDLASNLERAELSY